MTTLSMDPYDQHDYGDPDDAVVKGDTLRCRDCQRYDESVYPTDGRCQRCYEARVNRWLRVVGR